MDLHPLAHGFADAADAYELGRPGYPPEAIEVLCDELRLAPGARVADVGAGTGKLTRALLAAGLDVVAVEPADGMRARLREELGVVEARAGTAEALPLPDGSVDAVAVGEAFHWFDAARAVPELARVIRPGGGLGVLAHAAAGDSALEGRAWAVELNQVLRAVRPTDHPAFVQEGSLSDPIEAHDAFGPVMRTDVTHIHRADRAAMVASVASMSFVGVMADDERRKLLEQIDRLLAAHDLETFETPLRTTVWTARRR